MTLNILKFQNEIKDTKQKLSDLMKDQFKTIFSKEEISITNYNTYNFYNFNSNIKPENDVPIINDNQNKKIKPTKSLSTYNNLPNKHKNKEKLNKNLKEIKQVIDNGKEKINKLKAENNKLKINIHKRSSGSLYNSNVIKNAFNNKIQNNLNKYNINKSVRKYTINNKINNFSIYSFNNKSSKYTLTEEVEVSNANNNTTIEPEIIEPVHDIIKNNKTISFKKLSSLTAEDNNNNLNTTNNTIIEKSKRESYRLSTKQIKTDNLSNIKILNNKHKQIFSDLLSNNNNLNNIIFDNLNKAVKILQNDNLKYIIKVENNNDDCVSIISENDKNYVNLSNNQSRLKLTVINQKQKNIKLNIHNEYDFQRKINKLEEENFTNSLNFSKIKNLLLKQNLKDFFEIKNKPRISKNHGNIPKKNSTYLNTEAFNIDNKKNKLSKLRSLRSTKKIKTMERNNSLTQDTKKENTHKNSIISLSLEPNSKPQSSHQTIVFEGLEKNIFDLNKITQESKIEEEEDEANNSMTSVSEKRSRFRMHIKNTSENSETSNVKNDFLIPISEKKSVMDFY